MVDGWLDDWMACEREKRKKQIPESEIENAVERKKLNTVNY